MRSRTTSYTSDFEEQALQRMLNFPFVDALFGRRSRRFFRGAEISDGTLAYKSRHSPFPLSELERMLILTAAGGNTSWHHAITRHARYAPHLSNYAGAAGGRTFPSAAGFHTSELFFTDDSGTYLFETRDAPAQGQRADDGSLSLVELVLAHRARIRKLSDQRLYLPAQEPYMEGHNTWVVNRPGTLLIIPMADVAQHALACLCYFAQNGYCIYDDINHCSIAGLNAFADIVDIENPLPLAAVLDQLSLAECTAELATAAYAGMLMQQAVGLGGWMFDGIDRLTVLGASGDPQVPGLGFRYDVDERWALPNPTGLPGVFEGYCPPHYADMRAAVEALCERKFGSGGPFHPDTPGPWKDSRTVRASAQVHDERFRECVALQAQYIYDTFGKFPATVPTIFILMYLQTHHLDLEYYDTLFQPGVYLSTHAAHMSNWHRIEE